MRLKPHWTHVLKRAWSVRFMAMAMLLSFGEIVLPVLHDHHFLDWLPGGTFSLLALFMTCAALFSRFIWQKHLNDC